MRKAHPDETISTTTEGVRMDLHYRDNVVRYCVVIEHLDGSVSANGPYELEAEARLAMYAMAEYEAEQLEAVVRHGRDESLVGDDEAGEDTMQLYVQRLGQPIDTDRTKV